MNWRDTYRDDAKCFDAMATEIERLQKELEERHTSIEEACKWIKRAQERICPSSKPPSDFDAWKFLNEAMWYLVGEED